LFQDLSGLLGDHRGLLRDHRWHPLIVLPWQADQFVVFHASNVADDDLLINPSGLLGELRLAGS
jgi:hypothetical protein